MLRPSSLAEFRPGARLFALLQRVLLALRRQTVKTEPALEMVSRWLVETGTATLYTMLGRISTEPVRRTVARCIKDDEVRHYKYFYCFFLRYQERERVVQSVVLRTLWNRTSEINGEDAYLAFKHVFLECRPDRRFHDSDYKAYCRQWKMLARRYYPYERAVHTVLKPLQLNG